MKGLNTLVINHEQMKVIVQDWWNKSTYSNKDIVTDVDKAEGGNFEIQLEEPAPSEETGEQI